MNLSNEIIKTIYGVIASLPIHTSEQRYALLQSAGLPSNLTSQIVIEGATGVFSRNLVAILARYGMLPDGRWALAAVLDSSRDYVGTEKQAQIDKLIQEITAEDGVTGDSQYQHRGLDEVIRDLNRIELKIDRAHAEDREMAVRILAALSQNQLTLEEANQIMSELQLWARGVRESNSELSPELRSQLDVISVDTTNVYKYFQVAIPIIPGILSYNIELGKQHEFDLAVIWKSIGSKLLPKTKRDEHSQEKKGLIGIGERWAVVVGVDYYEDATHYGKLSVCANDAKEIYDQLVVKGYEQERIRLLTDQIGEPPTRDNILVTLNAVSKAAEPDDVLVFYYSGHGDEIDDESYLVTRTGKRIALEDTAIKISRLKSIMKQSPAKAKVIILDACHSGAKMDGKGPRHMTEEFLRHVFFQAEGLAILASCKQGEFSYEWKANERSVFTYYLSEALQGESDLDSKGFVTVQDVNRHVSNGVKLWTSRRNLSQTPTLQAEMSGDIILVYSI